MIQKPSGLTDEQLVRFANELCQLSEIDETTIKPFSEYISGYPVTLCFESDMGSKEPYASYDDFDIHLVRDNQEGGCASLTKQPQASCGVVVALY